ncbi:MAG: class I SAM-dependent rRNA methyltransferase [Candidatus Zixiibacteriota bacterium]
MRIKKNAGAQFRPYHPWIYTGSLEKPSDDIQHGDFVHVELDGTIIATGMYSRHSMIAVRLMAYKRTTIDKEWVRERIQKAIRLRQDFGPLPLPQTTGWRVIFGQSDALPGLVADKYGDTVVIQISTAGMDTLRDIIVECLIEELKPRCIYERSDMVARSEEKLPNRTGLCYGEDFEYAEFLESGRRYLADFKAGQKTGFYLDQRELRNAIGEFSRNKKAVDIFSYTGAAGIAALAGGASSVEFVDSSASALDLCRRHTILNNFPEQNITTTEADVFQWIADKKEPEYDLVMLDPPALIKSRKHIEAGKKAYHFLNRAALRIIKDGGLFVTSSCSAYMTHDMMVEMLINALKQANVGLTIFKTVQQSPDHHVPVFFPEAFYLKSIFCTVQRF